MTEPPPVAESRVEQALRDALLRTQLVDEWPLGIRGVLGLRSKSTPGGTRIFWPILSRGPGRPPYRYIVLISKRDCDNWDLKRGLPLNYQDEWMAHASITSYEQASNLDHHDIRHSFEKRLYVYVIVVNEKGQKSMTSSIVIKAHALKAAWAWLKPKPRPKMLRITTTTTQVARKATVVTVVSHRKSTPVTMKPARKPRTALMPRIRHYARGILWILGVALTLFSAGMFFFDKGPGIAHTLRTKASAFSFTDVLAYLLYDTEFDPPAKDP